MFILLTTNPLTGFITDAILTFIYALLKTSIIERASISSKPSAIGNNTVFYIF